MFGLWALFGASTRRACPPSLVKAPMLSYFSSSGKVLSSNVARNFSSFKYCAWRAEDVKAVPSLMQEISTRGCLHGWASSRASAASPCPRPASTSPVDKTATVSRCPQQEGPSGKVLCCCRLPQKKPWCALLAQHPVIA